MNTVVTSREAILAVSRQIAATEGLHALSIRHVATACGIAVGSVYNYFPAKADLVTATVEQIWRGIFHGAGSCERDDDFVLCVRRLFESIRRGAQDYPAFFATHAGGFGPEERGKGKAMMERYFAHMQAGLTTALEADRRVRPDVFGDTLTKQDFVRFVFSNILTLLMSDATDCDTLCAIIQKLLYQ